MSSSSFESCLTGLGDSGFFVLAEALDSTHFVQTLASSFVFWTFDSSCSSSDDEDYSLSDSDSEAGSAASFSELEELLLDYTSSSRSSITFLISSESST